MYSYIKSMSEIKEVEMQQELKQEKEYVYNKNNKAKIVKRKYTVTSENARNPDIRNRIIEVMNKNKEELLKHICILNGYLFQYYSSSIIKLHGIPFLETCGSSVKNPVKSLPYFW